MAVREEMVGPGGVCSRGAVFLLADSALAFAANTHGHRVVVQHCDIMFDNTVCVDEQLVAYASERHSPSARAYMMYESRLVPPFATAWSSRSASLSYGFAAGAIVGTTTAGASSPHWIFKQCCALQTVPACRRAHRAKREATIHGSVPQAPNWQHNL